MSAITPSSSAFPEVAAEKREAITTTEGPLLIIAGPGSGKTRTLVERILYLVTECGARPEQLLVATFTEKAARELTTRVSNRLLQAGVRISLHEMYLGTLHSLFLRILGENANTPASRKTTAFSNPSTNSIFSTSGSKIFGHWKTSNCWCRPRRAGAGTRRGGWLSWSTR